MKVLILAAAALIAFAAAAQTPSTAPAGTAATQAEDPTETVCRSEAIPGSRRRQRTCRTRAEWAAQRSAYSDRNRDRDPIREERVPQAPMRTQYPY